MAKARLLAAVCTFGLLAAGPMIALGATTQPATGVPGSSKHVTKAADSDAYGTHHSGGKAHHAARSSHSMSPTAQNAEVDRLNQESLAAAQGGREYNAGGNSGSSYGGSGSYSGNSTAPSNMPAGTGASTSSGSK
ncbi:MAG TPA: hypothetical protein VN702_21425 [Acetobacteraceae bacterium]|nr:hypothetical protein [Acetobacteraceae bacterium]